MMLVDERDRNGQCVTHKVAARQELSAMHLTAMARLADLHPHEVGSPSSRALLAITWAGSNRG
jgi:hypothetical protein